jgi:uncharacterized membrane protein YraQ (UPF0718 family)
MGTWGDHSTTLKGSSANLSPFRVDVERIDAALKLSPCSTVDAFFILSLGSLFTPGAVVAFLVFGPMIDIKMLALLRTTFTASTLILLTMVVALLTVVMGLAVNVAL